MSNLEKLGVARWKIKDMSSNDYMVIDEVDDVVSVAGAGYSDYLYHNREDAQLIAAAPEMLEALIKEWKFIESFLSSNASRNDGYWYNEFLNRQNSIIGIIGRATYMSREEIKGLVND